MAGRHGQCARSRDRQWWVPKRAIRGAGGREKPRPRGARREYTRYLRNLRKGRHMSNKGMDRRTMFRGAAALAGGALALDVTESAAAPAAAGRTAGGGGLGRHGG